LTGVDRVLEQLASIEPVDEREAASIVAIRDRLAWPGDPFDERLNDHHVTASAFVTSARGVILLRHRRIGIWVQPGGHVDPGETPEEAAVREIGEETGLRARHVEPVDLFHVDVHPGPRGHTHYDLRYLLHAPPDDPRPGEGESREVYWLDFPTARAWCEPALVAALHKLERATRDAGVRD
jgi:8-oxo-dGTP pyrophosphatase MutT (NUDIX family)